MLVSLPWAGSYAEYIGIAVLLSSNWPEPVSGCGSYNRLTRACKARYMHHGDTLHHMRFLLYYTRAIVETGRRVRQ